MLAHDERGAAEQAHPPYAENVGGNEKIYPDETFAKEETDGDSLSHPQNEDSVESVDEEEDGVDPTRRRLSSHGTAVKVCHQTLEADALSQQGNGHHARAIPRAHFPEDPEEDAGNARGRYHLRPRAPVKHRDARRYSTRRRRSQLIIPLYMSG